MPLLVYVGCGGGKFKADIKTAQSGLSGVLNGQAHWVATQATQEGNTQLPCFPLEKSRVIPGFIQLIGYKVRSITNCKHFFFSSPPWTGKVENSENLKAGAATTGCTAQLALKRLKRLALLVHT